MRPFGGILLSIILVNVSVPSWSEEKKPLPNWNTIVCEVSAEESLKPCAAGWALHWFHHNWYLFEGSAKAVGTFATAGALALVAQVIYGETPAIHFVLQVSRAGTQAGMIVFAGAAMAAVLATASSVGVFYFSSVNSLGAPTKGKNGAVIYDDPKSHCKEIMAPYQTPDGLMKLFKLPEEEYMSVLPCIPENDAMFNFLVEGARNGQALQQQLRRP